MNYCPKCGGFMEERLVPWFGFVATVLACTTCGYYAETTNTDHTEVK